MKKRKIKINNRLFDKEKGRKQLITRKSEREINQMKLAGDLLVKTHKEIAKMIKPGITTMEIDTFVVIPGLIILAISLCVLTNKSPANFICFISRSLLRVINCFLPFSLSNNLLFILILRFFIKKS